MQARSIRPRAGVLLICLGRGTGLVETLMDLPKVYRARIRLDLRSESHDAEGPVEPVHVQTPPEPQRVAGTLAAFEGRIRQVPPALSAVKVGGRPAYRRARRGETINLPAREVQIYWIVLHAYAWPEVDIELACGRGTYVRALARDLGQRLGTGGCLTDLERTAVGPFTAAQAWTLERLAAAGPAAAVLTPDQVRACIGGPPVRVPPRPAARPDAGAKGRPAGR